MTHYVVYAFVNVCTHFCVSESGTIEEGSVQSRTKDFDFVRITSVSTFYERSVNSHLILFMRLFRHCLKITQNVAFEFHYFQPIFVQLKLS